MLGQHVAGLKIGHEQNVGVARDWRDDALLTGGIRVDRIVKSKRPVDLGAGDLDSAGWRLDRRPYLFETSVPGVFAVGDIRAGSVKRVASAVGEGSVVVQLVHRVLAG